ncbi:MAG: hypothetical protein INR64_05365 [Caulobacteraceae bacterium]|nr:hypothetical protein [Caulobacter sp.]
MIQQLLVDAIVACAALWLVWTFAPYGARKRFAALLPRGRPRAVAASPAAAGGVEGLQAVELDGRPPPAAKDCGPGCGCS